MIKDYFFHSSFIQCYPLGSSYLVGKVLSIGTVYTRVSCDLVYHATLKILASKHYFIIYYEYHASCIFERPDEIVLGRLGYDCKTR